MSNISELKFDDKNMNDHTEYGMSLLEKSLQQFGAGRSILIDKNNQIIAGNGVIEAAGNIGLEDMKVVETTGDKIVAVKRTDIELNSTKGRGLAMADNAVSEVDLSWNKDNVDEISEQFDIDPGEWISDWKEEDAVPIEDDAPEVDEKEEPKSVLGKIYQLGVHRLMCGSSTDEDNVSVLMNGNNAKMLFTSPPYSDMREYEGGKDLSVNNIASFIRVYCPYAELQCVNLGIQRKDNEVYQYWDEYIKIAKKSGYKFLAWNVWDKGKCGSIGQQSAFVPIRHEWIFVFGKEYFKINKTWEKRSKHKLNEVRRVRQADGTMKESSRGDMSNPLKAMESVVQIVSESSDIRKDHPAVYPVGLPAEYIKAITDENDVVVDPFGGSGSTLIACEQLGRKCYMMELDPHYCDVIRKRWWKFTHDGEEDGWEKGTPAI